MATTSNGVAARTKTAAADADAWTGADAVVRPNTHALSDWWLFPAACVRA
jgi:hypothetical protein